ncbi:hypothetical protein KFL_009670030 [Klebsormidium nitens]|uniref:Uncharacterized protein n=1 Tax=Klebsormidium nitens TaxID=105231 RepID=A0A1Y1IVJ8_KLENI|nr:hypothetical protein KFL_009670030 [Klebsormidium nitens]|eukprot:GAQ92288.1 hypothetical protein KFL_009670030 [Klebsormidium nitens]
MEDKENAPFPRRTLGAEFVYKFPWIDRDTEHFTLNGPGGSPSGIIKALNGFFNKVTEALRLNEVRVYLSQAEEKARQRRKKRTNRQHCQRVVNRTETWAAWSGAASHLCDEAKKTPAPTSRMLVNLDDFKDFQEKLREEMHRAGMTSMSNKDLQGTRGDDQNAVEGISAEPALGLAGEGDAAEEGARVTNAEGAERSDFRQNSYVPTSPVYNKRNFQATHDADLNAPLERGKKRKHDEARGKAGAASEPCGEGREQVVESETAGAREESDSEASSQRAASSGGDDCEEADDETSEEDEEETMSDREMLDNRLQQVDSAHDHRRADQEREIGADRMGAPQLGGS